jgi:phosphopantetheinyl transferase (holo-ACP synthase)
VSSTGNDIIALKAINTERTKQVQFYSKILSPSEEALYRSEQFAEMPFQNFVWLLWSVKESVYKYAKRSIPDLIFSPRKIIIQSIDSPGNNLAPKFGHGQCERTSFDEEDSYNSIAYFESAIFHSRSKVYDELIHTVVNAGETFEDTSWGIKYIGQTDTESQSKEVRAFVLNTLAPIFPNDHLTIEKSIAGHPVLFRKTEEMEIPLSLSHHAHFVAYSFLLKGKSHLPCIIH